MDNIKIYEINEKYIDYLMDYAPHLFRSKKDEQKKSRKHIGIVLHINEFEYFAPLSSFKPKHDLMRNDMIDLIKIKKYAVINLNNMFPVPNGQYKYIEFSEEKDEAYRNLLMAEYRAIKALQTKIRKNAYQIYKHKLSAKNTTKLSQRCNDFSLLEEACKKFEHSDYLIKTTKQ